MDYNAISTLIAALVSGFVAFWVCKWQVAKVKLSSEEARLNEQLFNIVK